MTRTGWGTAVLAVAIALASTGCDHLPGKPGFRPETQRPDQTHDFAVLYKTNCSACHGDQGKNGPAFPLNNPVYLAWAGHDAIRDIVANGVANRLMPAFASSAGGLLTGEQVEDIVNGMMTHWGQQNILNGQTLPAYTPSTERDAAQGKDVFQSYCARCHGADGKGLSAGIDNVPGSIVDPSYLALISSRGLRDIVVAGMPGEKMPDWRGDVAGKPMTEKDVTNVVAWLVSHRTSYPGTFVSPAVVHEKEAKKAREKSTGSRR
jgi:mono/diheme cytochrome c family protein